MTTTFFHLNHLTMVVEPIPVSGEFDFLQEATEGFAANFDSLKENTISTDYNIANVIDWLNTNNCVGKLSIVNGFYTQDFVDRLNAANHPLADEVNNRKERLIAILVAKDAALNTFAFDLGDIMP